MTRSSIAQHETSGKTTNNGSAAKRKADTPLAKPDAAKKQATSANKRDSTKKKEKTTAPKENASKGSTKIIAAKSAPAEEKADASTSKGSTNDAAKKHVTFSLQLPKLIKVCHYLQILVSIILIVSGYWKCRHCYSTTRVYRFQPFIWRLSLYA